MDIKNINKFKDSALSIEAQEQVRGGTCWVAIAVVGTYMLIKSTENDDHECGEGCDCDADCG
ncbi:hypothetical protein [Cardinium endosymbiont of Culicoides punctatus]|uniref:hypothetical protein n=1 Tax=Cardinium endosymbiont of Culicoides punctatus TaxID=2304601 RepID=UPI0010590B9A|nr:hypothetical protein [Cardinium endosymbiont of Culicoides punctatus]TDG95774.1 hypothetical protein CCPUN_00590 [Cardinium endosymbiont of Culicoides punctatus]